jgi:predicted nucleic acid-binding protein
VIVVADTSVLCYLALLDCLDILPRRFGAIVIPPEVADECVQPGAPDKLRAFIGNPPDWLRIMDAPMEQISELATLDAGEAAAIRLALSRRETLLLIDERRGRALAKSLGLAVSGTLGVLADAARRGWIDFDQMIHRLRTQTNFRVSPEVIAGLRRVSRETR